MAERETRSQRSKTPAERGEEAQGVQRRLKDEAAERRKKALAAADPRPSKPRRAR